MIQDGVDAASWGDTVRVADGVYDTGGAVTPGYASANRVCITNAITVESVNGPESTLIVGQGPVGDAAVRCVYMVDGAVLTGFTLTNGYTRTSDDIHLEQSGGGALLHEGGTISNCVVTHCQAGRYGGGVHGYLGGSILDSEVKHNLTDGGSGGLKEGGGIKLHYGETVERCHIHHNRSRNDGGGIFVHRIGLVRNSLIETNYASSGGGVYLEEYSGNPPGKPLLHSCTVAGNTSSYDGGGVRFFSGGEARNCVIYNNSASRGANCETNRSSRIKIDYTCTTPLPTSGVGNISDDPSFVDPGSGDYRLNSVSPCREAGINEAWMTGADDFQGNPRIVDSTVDMGAYEIQQPQVDVTNVFETVYGEVANYTVGGTCAHVEGSLTWTNAATGGSGAFAIASPWSVSVPLAFGSNAITVRGTNALGWATSDSVTVIRRVEHGPNSPTHYVGTNSPSPAYPYTNWSTAAHTIQDAVDVASSNDTVLVADGVYDAGGAAAPGAASMNRVMIERAITVASVGGPSNTFIVGAGPNGGSAVRCARLGEGALLSGFTLTNGHTRTSGDQNTERGGGGVLLYNGGTVSNCVIAGNACHGRGGGANCHHGGTIVDSVLRGNRSADDAGGALVEKGRLERCEIFGNSADGDDGGGLYFYPLGSACEVNVYSNTCGDAGGGVYFYNGGALSNSTVEANTSDGGGGGILLRVGALVEGCTIRGNHAGDGTEEDGGAIWLYSGGTVRNCLMTGNTAQNCGGAMFFSGGASNAVVENCTVVSNHAEVGGGVRMWNGTVRNCIVVDNTYWGTHGPNWSRGGNSPAIEYTCTTPLDGIPGGEGCIDDAPLFVGTTDHRLTTRSPCINAGANALVTGTLDLDGVPRWQGTVDMGCYEGPWLDISTTPVTVSYDVTSYPVAGTNYAHSVGTTVSNRLNGVILAAGSGLDWSADVPLSVGGNTVVAYATNAFGSGGRSAPVVITRGDIGTGAPYTAVTTTPVTVSYDVTAIDLAGTNNAHVAGAMWWTNELSGAASFFGDFAPGAGGSTWQETVDLAVGANEITVYGSNEWGEVAGDTISIVRGGIGTGAPVVDIITPSQTVPFETISMTIEGTNNRHVQEITWTNGLTGGHGVAAKSDSTFSIPGVGLAVGDNEIFVHSTNLWGVSSDDTVTITRRPLTNYVSLLGNHVHPYATWADAATNIQDAVDAVSAGGTTLVTNGTYAISSRIEVNKEMTLASVNGPSETTVDGGGRTRCFYLLDPASVLSGFTATNGAGGDGGGVCCSTTNTVVTNCIIVGNYARDYGGGVYKGSVYNCTIAGNRAGEEGGGTYESILFNCTVSGNRATLDGGGTYQGTAYNCTISGNRANRYGGGAFQGAVSSCWITDNSAGGKGGGTYRSRVNGCTIVANSALDTGGGACAGTVWNSVIYYNTATVGGNTFGASVSYSCTIPDPGGVGNVTSRPVLLSYGNPRIATSSPCINAGTNSYVVASSDIDGDPRIAGGTVDMGCDEVSNTTGGLVVDIIAEFTNVVVNKELSMTADIRGKAASSLWEIETSGPNVDAGNVPEIKPAWGEAGVYNVTLSAFNDDNPAGVSTTVTIHVLSAYTNYVSLAGTHTHPYTSWATAATNIQDAVDAVDVAGGVVLVTNGVYDAGGGVTPGYSALNRVVIERDIIVASANGASNTTLAGQGPIGNSAVRCVFISAGEMRGFTLSHGHTMAEGDRVYDESGGGALVCGGVVVDCIIKDNSARHGGGTACGIVWHCLILTNDAVAYGGGAFYSTLGNCVVSGNEAQYGGGTYRGEINQSTIAGNSARSSGGGTCYGSVENSIVWNNSAPSLANWQSSTYRYSCTTPKPDGTGNIDGDPRLAEVANGDYHLRSRGGRWNPATGSWVGDAVGSPCIDAADPVADYGSEPDPNGGRANMGAYGNTAQASKSPPSITITDPAGATNVYGQVAAYPVAGTATGLVGWISWTNAANGAVGTCAAANDWQAAGIPLEHGDNVITVFATNGFNHSDGDSVTITRLTEYGPHASPHYVWTNSPSPAYPYTNWATAAHTIRDAVDIASDGSTVLVTNGTYVLSAEIAVTRSITLSSVNGPTNTIVDGDGAVRCFNLGNSSCVVNGLTLSGGSAGTSYGGGVYCSGASPVITNCIVSNNSARYGGGMRRGRIHNSTVSGNTSEYTGGGVYESTVYASTIIGNTAGSDGGGAYESSIHGSTIRDNSARDGGGAHAGTIYGCTIAGNRASNQGGGTHESTVYNSHVFANRAYSGGGAYDGNIHNCTIVDNRAVNEGGGVSSADVYNSIVYYNRAKNANNCFSSFGHYNCSTPLLGGTGNFTNEPALVSYANPHLVAGSPCIDAGDNSRVSGDADIDGDARIVAGTVEIGCDEVTNLTGSLSVAVDPEATRVVVNKELSLEARIQGKASHALWRIATSGGGAEYVTNSPAVERAWSLPGSYDVSLAAFNDDNPGGVVATVTIQVVSGYTNYVSPSGAHVAPYESWATAATNIQSGIDAMDTVGGTVLIGDGRYGASPSDPAYVTPGYSLSNRVVLAGDIVVRSANGPASTIIVGASAPGGGVGDGAVRCVFMSDGILSGVTLSNGYTMATGDSSFDRGGAGVCVDGGVVSNCIITHNTANYRGGGVCFGTVYGCTIRNNSADHGGGLYQGRVYNSTLSDNSAKFGGGAVRGWVYNCLVTGNSAVNYGGGGVQLQGFRCDRERQQCRLRRRRPQWLGDEFNPLLQFRFGCGRQLAVWGILVQLQHPEARWHREHLRRSAVCRQGRRQLPPGIRFALYRRGRDGACVWRDRPGREPAVPGRGGGHGVLRGAQLRSGSVADTLRLDQQPVAGLALHQLGHGGARHSGCGGCRREQRYRAGDQRCVRQRRGCCPRLRPDEPRVRYTPGRTSERQRPGYDDYRWRRQHRRG